jgi:hypothetical protein
MQYTTPVILLVPRVGPHEEADDKENENRRLKKAVKALQQQLDDDQHETLKNDLVTYFNRFFTKVLCLWSRPHKAKSISHCI